MPTPRTVLLALLLLPLLLTGCVSLAANRGLQLEPMEGEAGGTPRIAVIDVDGEIGFGGGSLLRGGADAEEIAIRLRLAEQDDTVKAVVLVLNTPGGDVVASETLHQRVLAVRRAGKPVVALSRSLNASGGYYISAACDRILVSRGTLIGSIGVIFMTPDLHGLLEDRLGVKMVTVTSGPRKDLGSPFRPMTDEEKAIIKAMVDRTYGQFLAVVVAGRAGHGPIPADPAAAEAMLRPLADGRVVIGEEAVTLGLADGLGQLPEALAEARRLAGLEKAGVIRYRRDGGIFGLMGEGAGATPQAQGNTQVTNGLHIDAGSLAEGLRPRLAYLWAVGR